VCTVSVVWSCVQCAMCCMLCSVPCGYSTEGMSNALHVVCSASCAEPCALLNCVLYVLYAMCIVLYNFCCAVVKYTYAVARSSTHSTAHSTRNTHRTPTHLTQHIQTHTANTYREHKEQTHTQFTFWGIRGLVICLSHGRRDTFTEPATLQGSCKGRGGAHSHILLCCAAV
jgi:hypothetical protein